MVITSQDIPWKLQIKLKRKGLLFLMMAINLSLDCVIGRRKDYWWERNTSRWIILGLFPNLRPSDVKSLVLAH